MYGDLRHETLDAYTNMKILNGSDDELAAYKVQKVRSIGEVFLIFFTNFSKSINILTYKILYYIKLLKR